MIDHILGDLHEEFRLLCRERGAHAARFWYARQILLSFPMMVKPVDGLRVLAVAGRSP